MITDDFEQIYNKMLEDFKNIEKIVVDRIINDNFSIILGEEELIEDFTDYLKINGIDIGHDINHIFIGHEINEAEPIKIIRTNTRTNEVKFLEMCLIKKTEKFMNLIALDKSEKDENDIDEDLDKLIYIELDLTDAGKKSVYSNFLEKNKEMNEENVLEAIDKIFNIENSLKLQILHALKMTVTEKENNDIMYV